MSSARRRFRFIKEIAEGGFGKVYLAEQLSADGFSRIVAVKLLHAKWSSHDEVVMRTRDEARLLGLIRHQHIVKVEDLSSIDGKCAIVMEYLEGVDLKYMMTFLREKNEIFPRAALFETMLQACSALDAAYNGAPLQGGDPLKVIHRDIKPSNIFMTVPGTTKVLDFGTARANFAEREAKTQALAFGSQGYMAPERMLGEEDTPAADIFSLGVTLYELLTFESFGRIPPRPQKFLQKVQDRVAAVPLTGDPAWQQQVRDTLTHMLAYDPKERPTAAQLVDTFENLATGAGDTSLRKFCRTVVAEAKAQEPAVESGDPLNGQLVDEDESSPFKLGNDGQDQVAGTGTPPPAPETSGQRKRAGQQTTASREPTSGSRPKGNLAPPADDAPAGGGGPPIALIAGVVVVLLLLGGVAIVAVVGVGGLAVFFGSGAATTAPTTSSASSSGTDTPPVTPPPVSKDPVCKVTAEDTRTDVAKVPTKLLASVPAGADISITGGVGFKAEWDGKTDCDVGSLAVGGYRTKVGSERGKFEVKAGTECTFTWDPAAKSWTEACK